MKMFGSSKSSHHTGTNSASKNGKSEKKKKGGRAEKGGETPGRTKRVVLIVLAVVMSLVAVLTAAAAIFWFTQVKPPDVTQEKGAGHGTNLDEGAADPAIVDPSVDPAGGHQGTGSGDGEEDQGEGAPAREGDKYTFLAVGMDDGNGNTDTIMVATFDTKNYSLNVVSIPRDTLVNVSWSVKKANSLYSHGGIETLKSGIADIIGFVPDFYGILELDAFVKLIDAIGGVYFDVPQDMVYDDNYQDLHINIKKGPQTLSGEDTMKVWRYRYSYGEGDIKRIEVQHDLLMAVAEQVLEKKDSIPITTLAEIIVDDAETDLELGEAIWFIKELLKMDLENIQIMTIPANYFDNKTYPIILADEWLTMLNTYFNPFNEDMVEEDLSILAYSSSGYAYSTDGYYASDSCKKIPTRS